MEAITIHPENEEQLNALEIILKAMKVPFEKSKTAKSPYDPEFVAKIKRSEKNFAEGKYTTVKNRRFMEIDLDEEAKVDLDFWKKSGNTAIQKKIQQ